MNRVIRVGNPTERLISSRIGLDNGRVKGGNRESSGLFETHSHAQSCDYTDVVTITLTVTLSPRRLSADVVKERADRDRAGEMIVVERSGYLKYATLSRYINDLTSAQQNRNALR